MSELSQPPLIGPYAPENMKMRGHHGDDPYQQGGGGPVLSGRVSKRQRATALPPVPVEKKALQAEKAAIDSLSRSIRDEEAAMQMEKDFIEQLKQNNPNDPQIQVRQNDLRILRAAHGRRTTVLGERRRVYKESLAVLQQNTEKKPTKRERKALRAQQDQAKAKVPRAEKRRATREAKEAKASIQQGLLDRQMGAPALVHSGNVYNQMPQQIHPTRNADFQDAAPHSGNAHSQYIFNPEEAGNGYQQHISFGQQMYDPTPAQFANGYIQIQAPNQVDNAHIQQQFGNQYSVPMQQPTQYVTAPDMLNIRDFRNITDARNALQSAQAQTNAPINWVQPTDPKIMPHHVYLGAGAPPQPVGRRWASGEQSVWKQQQMVGKMALQQHKQEAQQQKENAAREGKPDTIPQVIQAGFKPFQAYGKIFTDPIEVAAWQQQVVAENDGPQGHKQELTSQQQKEIEVAFKRRNNGQISLNQQKKKEAAAERQKNSEIAFQRQKENEASRRQTEAAQQQNQDMGGTSDAEILDPNHLPALYGTGAYVGIGFCHPNLTQDHSSILTREKLQERDARRANLQKILFAPLASISVIDLTGDEPDDAVMGASNTAEASAAQTKEQFDVMVMDANNFLEPSSTQVAQQAMGVNDFLESSSTQVAQEALAMMGITGAAEEMTSDFHDEHILEQPSELLKVMGAEDPAPAQPELQAQPDSGMGGV